jgi:2-polyprenyl-6-hydroxyphenyl methylase/3-demethylubiquinone-9 3-methyltransferase
MQATAGPIADPTAGPTTGQISAEEIARFDRLAARWWDPTGPMRPLHAMNPVRVGWITERIRQRYPNFAGLRVLDIGCGAGLASEALARAGLDVLGIDAAGEAIEAARKHAAGRGLSLAYRNGVAEDLLGQRFPVIVALEVIEHVPDPRRFIATLADLLEPQGLLFISTLNRTARSFLMAKLGAEYVLRWLPVGTHDWRRFITPAEMGRMLRASGLRISDLAGLGFEPLTGRWKTSRDLSVNYLLSAER